MANASNARLSDTTVAKSADERTMWDSSLNSRGDPDLIAGVVATHQEKSTMANPASRIRKIEPGIDATALACCAP